MFEKAVGPQTPLFSTAAASPKKKMDQKFHFHDSSVTLHFRNLQIPLEIKMTCNVESLKCRNDKASGSVRYLIPTTVEPA